MGEFFGWCKGYWLLGAPMGWEEFAEEFSKTRNNVIFIGEGRRNLPSSKWDLWALLFRDSSAFFFFCQDGNVQTCFCCHEGDVGSASHGIPKWKARCILPAPMVPSSIGYNGPMENLNTKYHLQSWWAPRRGFMGLESMWRWSWF